MTVQSAAGTLAGTYKLIVAGPLGVVETYDNLVTPADAAVAEADAKQAESDRQERAQQDRDPPAPRAFTDNNADVATYSPLGRLTYASVELQF